MSTDLNLSLRGAALDKEAPLRLNHLAYVTSDAQATVDFYTKVMRMPLIEAVMHEKVPSTGDPYPYVHFFFRMQDGSTIAFFEVVGLPERREPSHAAYRTFDHLALEVANPAMVDAWKVWLLSHDIEVVGPVDHTIIYSIYFFDPNGIRLEITTPLVADWNDRPDAASKVVNTWIEAKAFAASSGTPFDQVLVATVVAQEGK